MRISNRRLLLGGASWAIALHLGAGAARAGGVEATVAGSRAQGRGGAMISSAEGFDALRYDPARLALGPRWTFGADAQVHFTDVCFDRDDGDGAEHPRVCNQAGPQLVPMLGASFRIGERVGIGIGVLPPPGTPLVRFGNTTDGTIEVDGQRVPSPSRHANVLTENTAIFHTIGMGVALHERLRIGASFGWGTISVQNISFTAGIPGAGPSLDTRTALSTVDNFVPRVSFGIDFEPVRGLGVSSVTTWTDDFRGDASLFLSGLTGGGFSTRVDDVRVHQAFGWESTVGLRVAQPRWDVELDGMFQGHGRTQQVTVDIPDDATLPIDSTINGEPLNQLPDARYVQRRWKDQLVLRLGGEVLAVPDRLRIRAGLSYESRGVRRGYESVENFLVPRTGAHVGMSVDVHPRVQVTAGYSRIFQQTTTVSPQQASVPQPVGAQPGGLADEVVYVNGGRYQGGIHVLSVSVLVRAQPERSPSP